MYIYQLSTGYTKQFGVRRTVNVTDLSEDIDAEVATGKNLVTGEWCASLDFSYE